MELRLFCPVCWVARSNAMVSFLWIPIQRVVHLEAN